METIIRHGHPEECREVENVLREAFWDLYRPECNEHYIYHRIRQSSAYIPELDWIAEADDRIVGGIISSKAQVVDYNGLNHPIICLGPIGVLPEYQGLGIGEKLISKSLEEAEKTGFQAVVVLGDPAYYSQFGFEKASIYHIRSSEAENPDNLLVKELKPNGLEGITGKVLFDPAFQTDEAAVDEFDRDFPTKPKKEAGPEVKESNRDEEQKWKRYNVIIGIFLGIILGFILFGIPQKYLDDGLRLTIMLVIILFFPQIFEKKFQVKFRLGRLWMAGTLIFCTILFIFFKLI